jgi:hypothetical protein
MSNVISNCLGMVRMMTVATDPEPDFLATLESSLRAASWRKYPVRDAASPKTVEPIVLGVKELRGVWVWQLPGMITRKVISCAKASERAPDGDSDSTGRSEESRPHRALLGCNHGLVRSEVGGVALFVDSLSGLVRSAGF